MINAIFQNKYISKLTNRHFVLILCALFITASTNKYATILLTLVFILFSLLINAICVNSRNDIIIKLIVISILFQNLFIGIGAHAFGNASSSLSLVTQFPFIFITVSGLFSFLYKKIDRTDIVFLVFVFLCLIYCFIGDAPISARLVYLRNFTVFYFAFLSARHYLNTKEKLGKFIDFTINISIVAGIFGIVGIILGKPFYEFFGVNEVYIAKKALVFLDGLPGNFYTIINNNLVLRMASFYLEPVNFSYFMSFGVIMAFSRKRWISFAFLGICEILTFGKGGWLIMAAFLCAVAAHTAIQKIFPKFTVKQVRNIMFGLIIAGVSGISLIFYFFFMTSFGGYMHFYGIISAVKYIAKWPFGYGMGTAGNILRGLNVSSAYEVTETGLANMAYQIGIIGTILFIYIIMCMSGNVINYIKENRKSNFSVIITGYLYIPLILLLVSLFQENTFTPQCITMHMLILGALSVNSHHENGKGFEIINNLKFKLLKITPEEDKPETAYSKDTCIMTLYYNNYNYGGLLQAYALQKVLTKLGHNAEVISYQQNKIRKLCYRIKALGLFKTYTAIIDKVKFKKMLGKRQKKILFNERISKYNDFIKHIPHTCLYNDDSIYDIKDRYINYICGSDQIWNPNWWDMNYFLNFAPDNANTISYAASMGISQLNNRQRNQLKQGLKHIRHISVREIQAAEIIRQSMGSNADIVLDPTLLLDSSEWDTLATDSPEIKGDYVFGYILNNPDEYIPKIKKLCQEQGLKFFNIPYPKCTINSCDENNEYLWSTGPREWLGLIKNAKYVFTDSFHGTAFSIIFNKNFSTIHINSIGGKKAYASRLYSLLELFGLETRIITDFNVLDKTLFDRDINYITVNKIKMKLQEKSIKFLSNSLK